MGNLFDGLVNEVRLAEAERNRKAASEFKAGKKHLLEAYNRHEEMITKVVQQDYTFFYFAYSIPQAVFNIFSYSFVSLVLLP